MVGLLHHVLPAHHRVGGLVGKAHPARARRERHGHLVAALLVGHVGLHAVVQLQHQVVVFATQRLGDVQRVQHLGLPGRVRLGTRQKALGHGLERLTHAPHARGAVRVDVGEHAQDPLAVRGTRRKGVDVQALVVGAPGLGARLDPHRPVAGGRAAQCTTVAGQQAGHQSVGTSAKARHHGRQRLLRARIAHRTLDAAVHVQADVAGLGLADVGAQEALLLLAQPETQAGKVQHLAGFQRIHPLAPRGHSLPVRGVDFNDAVGHGRCCPWFGAKAWDCRAPAPLRLDARQT